MIAMLRSLEITLRSRVGLTALGKAAHDTRHFASSLHRDAIAAEWQFGNFVPRVDPPVAFRGAKPTVGRNALADGPRSRCR